MKKLNVIDLDKTLLPFDSFTHLLFRSLLKPNCFFILSYLILLRVVGSLDRENFARRVLLLLQKQKIFFQEMQAYEDELFNQLDPDVIQLIQAHSDTETINVLCSASPVDYVAPLAQKLNWECLCTHFEDSDSVSNPIFHHLYSEKKMLAVLKKYPDSFYSYNFSISDSESDLSLLKLFTHSVLFKKETQKCVASLE